jgi:hypothetical protein
LNEALPFIGGISAGNTIFTLDQRTPLWSGNPETQR